MPHRLRTAGVAALLLILPAMALCAPREFRLQGKTMGTTYTIKVVVPAGIETDSLQTRIDDLLDGINRSMSTFIADSEISRFNRWSDVLRPFPVSDDFFEVMRVAGEIYRLTRGAWDGTVHPLIDLWGFGSSGPIDRVPSGQAIEQALQRVGFDNIEVSRGHLRKRRPDVAIDLASIAKGHGVDRVARLLRHLGYGDFLVEIGGEVYAAGRRLDGKAWKVGINRPEKTASFTAVYKVLTLQNRAMATSGDYRNYEEIDGRTYSHIIDPRTGYPVAHDVVSASVIAANCTLADGLATAMMVMNPSQGVALLNRLKDVEGLIISRRADGTFQDHWSKGLAVE